MAGGAPDDDTYYPVYCYNVDGDQWVQLPAPGHYCGILQIIDGKLTVIGGEDNVTRKITNKVTTYINNGWTSHFPNLLRARSKPGVVSYSEYVIVAGGQKDGDTVNDDIEVLNITLPSQWMMTDILLPEPMRAIYPTISDSNILIVGYNTLRDAKTPSYQLPLNVIISTQATSDQPLQWMKLPSAPHYNTRTIPNSHPPVIMGGSIKGVPISDVAVLDESSKTWKKVSSLSSPRDCVALVLLDADTILVLGGSTGGVGITEAMEHSITTMEKGRVNLMQRAAAIPSQDSQCSIQ